MKFIHVSKICICGEKTLLEWCYAKKLVVSVQMNLTANEILSMMQGVVVYRMLSTLVCKYIYYIY
jgi:hypothetical protein